MVARAWAFCWLASKCARHLAVVAAEVAGVAATQHISTVARSRFLLLRISLCGFVKEVSTRSSLTIPSLSSAPRLS